MRADVPERLERATVRGPMVEASSDAILVRIPNVARYLVRGDGTTTVDRADGATDADVRCFAEGPVAAAAALLAGCLPLRASAVSVGGRAAVLCGPSTAGKSALAAALALRGHAVLADAVSVVGPGAHGASPFATAGAHEPVLWPDMVQALGLSDVPSRRVRPALEARAYGLGPPPVAAPVGVVVLLRVDPAAAALRIQPVTGAAKLPALLGTSWLPRLLATPRLAGAAFAVTASLAQSTPLVSLVRPRAGASPQALAPMVEGLLT